jgi:hypothetical protein
MSGSARPPIPPTLDNELARSTATYANSVASTLFITGGVTPALGVLYHIVPDTVPLVPVLIGSALLIASSVAIHFGVRLFLARNLTP